MMKWLKSELFPANNEKEIGEYNIPSFCIKLVNEGVITVEEAKGTDTYVDVVEGMQFDRGYLYHLILLPDADKMIAEFRKSTIFLLFDKKIN